MRLRKLLVLEKKTLEILHAQSFPVVEVSCLNNPEYAEMPSSNRAIVTAFSEKFTVEGNHTINFKAERDSCDREDWFPVFKLNVEEKAVWPVVFITTSKHILMGIPLVKTSAASRGFANVPEIPAAVQLLDTVGIFLKELNAEITGEEPLFDIGDVLNFIAPYGILINTSVSNFRNALLGTAALEDSSKAYIQSNAKPNPAITITIKETVKGVIYNRKRLSDSFDYTGTVSILSSLPVKTDISVTLLTTLNLVHVVPRCDKFLDTSKNNELQLFLTPGYDNTELFRYTFEQVDPPIMADYSVTRDHLGLAFSIELQFFPEKKITFECIEVVFPFPNRGPINSLKFDPPNSDVVMNKKKNQIIWRRTKLPNTDKLSLTASVKFDRKQVQLDGHPQLRDVNAYADITFQSPSSLSKMRLDKNSVTVFPGTKFKLNHEVISSGQSIRVWNTHGEVFDQ